MIDNIKTFIVGIVTGVLAYLQPLGTEIYILAYIFIFNFAVGLLTDLFVNNAKFQFKKFWQCIVQLTTFFILICSVFWFGDHKGWGDGAVQCVSGITYIITWAFSVKMLDNLRSWFGDKSEAREVLDILYYILSIEIVKKLPYVKRYQDEIKNKENEQPETHIQEDDN